MFWSWEIKGYHQNKRISWGLLIRSSNLICLGKHNIRRDCIGGYSRTAPLGFFLHYISWRFSPNLMMEIQEVLFTRDLKFCPKCHAKLKIRSDGEVCYC